MDKTKETSKTKISTVKTEKSEQEAPVQNTRRKSKKADEPPKDIPCCSFCGKLSTQARRTIAAPNSIFICDECVEVCARVLLEDLPLEWRFRLIQLIAEPQNPIEVSFMEERKKGKTKQKSQKNNIEGNSNV